MAYTAVIDIGSNSVRFVVYSGVERVADTIFNEKIMCGLGEEVGKTGMLGGTAVDMAKLALQRFNALAKRMKIKNIQAIATAAVRDAANGHWFVDMVREECGIDVRVLSGDEEARYSGYGVISGSPEAEGAMGDLGGGSLELARIKDGNVHERVSLPIGPFRLIAKFGNDYDATKAYLKEQFSQIDWLKKVKDQEFHLVGGAWRTIGRLLMRERALSLPILQGYSVPRQDITVYAKRLSRLRGEDIPHSDLIANRRRDVIPVAALILRTAIKVMKPQEAIFASYGLREGLLYDQLPRETRNTDPFLYSCRSLSEERSRFNEHADLLFDWTRPLFDTSELENESRTRLHRAVCLLSDIAWRGHPDFRAEKAVEAILHGHFVGVTHQERAFVAVALNQAYGAPVDVPEVASILGLLKINEILEARVLGAALRLAHRLSGGSIHGLDTGKLNVQGGYLYLSLPPEDSELISTVVARRLGQLASLLGRRSQILVGGQPATL